MEMNKAYEMEEEIRKRWELVLKTSNCKVRGELISRFGFGFNYVGSDNVNKIFTENF